MSQTLDRRSVLAAGVAALTAGSYQRVWGANERVGLGLIGFGLIAQTHVATFRKLDDAEFVGVAEVHRGRLDEGLKAVGGRAEGVSDFRKLLDRKDVQAVVVATPDHWHAMMTMLACAAGKDVYVEKPATLFVREGEWMQQVATRTKRVVQVGTQQRSGEHYQKARELVRGGHLGTVVSVRMQAIRNVHPGFGKPADADPPAGFDWDAWLGPAPQRRYNPLRGLYHFRWFWDTSGGQMTNLGAHHLDIVDWFLGLETLRRVVSIGGRFALNDGGETPDTQDVIFDCGKYSATFTMREAAQGEKASFGLVFHGTRASLGIDRRGFAVTADPDVPPANQVPGVKTGHPTGGPRAVVENAPAKVRTEEVENRSGDSAAQYLGHARDFLDCIKSRGTPRADLASGHRVATACHLANLALRLERSLRYNGKQILDDAEAARMMVRAYRTPWDRELAALGIESR